MRTSLSYRRLHPTPRWTAPLAAVAVAVLVGGCAASAGVSSVATPTDVGAIGPTALVSATPLSTSWPTTVPALGDPWVPATDADTALADQVDTVWTENEVDAVDDLYTPDAELWLGWAGVMDLATLREQVEITPNSYERVSAVTQTTTAITGLAPLPAGDRYLHYVVVIHTRLFDTILEVTPAGQIVKHYGDAYQPAEVRTRDGFPNFIALEPSTNPTSG